MKLVEQQKVFFFIFFTGFIVGILYTNLIAVDYLTMTSVFCGYYLNEYISARWTFADCLLQVVYVRVMPLIGILVIGYSKLNRVGVMLFLAWTGFLCGIYMSMGIAQLGLNGIVFCLIGMFPQILFYIPAYLIAVIFSYKYPMSQWSTAKIGVIIMCMISGIILECQVNPYIMRWFIKLL
ncbi:MAG: stage II sporulation protein M [Eubacteriales bacterium]